MIFFEVGRAGNNFWSGPENPDSQGGRLPLPESTSPEKFVGGGGGNVTSSVFHKLFLFLVEVCENILMLVLMVCELHPLRQP